MRDRRMLGQGPQQVPQQVDDEFQRQTAVERAIRALTEGLSTPGDGQAAERASGGGPPAAGPRRRQPGHVTETDGGGARLRDRDHLARRDGEVRAAGEASGGTEGLQAQVRPGLHVPRQGAAFTHSWLLRW